MRKYYVIAVSAAVGLLAGFFLQPLISEDNIYNQLRKFQEIFNTASRNYVEEVDTHKLIEAAIKGMLNELDPHSVYISADDMKRVDEDMEGSFEGIGIEFDIINDTITVVSPIPGGPSETLGIMSGDKIINIDNKNSIGIDRGEVPKRLKGPQGTKVVVEIKRGRSPELLRFDITRDKIPLNSLETAFMFDDSKVGLIRISKFSATTFDEFAAAIRDLKSQGMQKLILDLRGNPGGYMNQAVMMADEFIPGGSIIVYTKGRRDEFDEVYTSTKTGQLENTPVIVLIDAGSASASEIVSGAIQDLDRGLILGTTSFGKGLVQRQYKAGDGSAYRITISKYYTPSGRCIQRPYEDKEQYRHLVGRLELEEGANIEHALEKFKKEGKDSKDGVNFDSIPMFKTRNGRTVLGGGGITPDYIVKYDTITNFSANIRNKNLFFYYINSYMDSRAEALRAKYKSNYKDFLRNFKIDADFVADFRKYVENKDVKWDDEQFKIDETYIKNALKANIARVIWDRTKMFEIIFSDDKMITTALGLFPEAERIAQFK